MKTQHPRRVPVMSKAIAAVVVLAAVLSGCTSAVGQRGADASSNDSASTGGTLRVGITEDLRPRSFLSIGLSSVNSGIAGNVFDTLVRYPREGLTPQPRLATTWQAAPDGLSLKLDLRDAVRFHNGKPLTSKDVEFTLRTYAEPEWSAQFRRTAAAVTTFDTSDPHSITLGFAAPVSNIFDLLSVMPILDSDTFGQLVEGKVFNGTGPFRFTGWQPKVGVDLVRNDDFWGEHARLDAVEFTVVRDASALRSRLRTGQIDIADGLSNHDAVLAERRGGFRVVPYEGAEANQYVGTNVTAPGLKDIRVRQAIAYALDRDRIIHDIYQGYGYATSLPWPKESAAFDESQNSTYIRNEERARELVAEVGDIPTIPLNYSAAANQRVIAEIVQSNLKDVGISTELRPTDQAEATSMLIAGKYPGLWILQHAFAQMTPSTLAVSAYPFNALKNSSNFSDPTYTANTNAAWNLPDALAPTAGGAYRKVSDDILQNLFLIEVGVVTPLIVAKSTVGGLDWSRINELRLEQAYLGN